MEIVYEWHLSEDIVPDYQGYTDYIYKLYWTYTGTKGAGVKGGNDYIASISGEIEFPEVILPFIPYADITYEMKIQWVLDKNDINQLKFNIARQIYHQEFTTEYNWYINNMDVVKEFNGYRNFVTRIWYRYSAVNNEGFDANYEGQLQFNQTPSGSYTPYGSISRDLATNWLKDNLDVELLTQKLDKILMEKTSPEILNLPLPFKY